MSLASACLWTLARTLVICLIAWPICAAVERWLRSLSDVRRSVALIGLLAPFCFPELLVGYALRDIALDHPRWFERLVRYLFSEWYEGATNRASVVRTIWAEALCGGLLFVRVVPVGAVALLMAPPPECDAAAIHCRRMLLAGVSRDLEWLELVRCYWHGPVSRTLPALGLMAVVAFQEFELAALLMVASWTDWFVAAERVGLARGEMLRQTAWPLLMQLPVLLGLIVWMRRDAERRRGDSRDEADVPTGRILSRVVLRLAPAYVALALIAGCVVPLSLIGWRIVDGLSLLARQRTQQLGLAREMAIATTVALCAGLTAWAICRCASSNGIRRPLIGPARLRRGVARWGLTFALLLPGLLGSLLLSLGAVTLFQVSWLRPLYDTPLPWVLALTLWLLPRAAVLQLWLDAMRPSEAVHLVEMLGGGRPVHLRVDSSQKTPHPNPLPAEPGRGDKSEVKSHAMSDLHPSAFIPHPSALLWRLRDQPQFLAMSLLCYWAYCDLPTAYLLAPTGMASGLVRLYNFMHFGRSAALSVEACLFFAAPLVGVGFVLLVVRWWRG